MQFAHIEAWGERGWLCYGCNTTVICVMKRIIYFLMTTNNQEVGTCSVSGRITVYWVKCICSLKPNSYCTFHWENCDIVQHKQTVKDGIVVLFSDWTYYILVGNSLHVLVFYKDWWAGTMKSFIWHICTRLYTLYTC